MAKQFTGIDGSLYADGNRVAKVTSWSFDANADALECTTLGDFARKYVYGLQSYAGTCSLLYYEKDGGVIDGSALMTDVIRTNAVATEPAHTLELRYSNGARSHSVRFTCLLPTVTIVSTVGEIATAEVSFTVSGPLTTATLS
jgi:hypothetical protein